MPVATDTRSAVALANRLRPVLLRLSRELRREAAAFGVTGRQAALLAVIKEHGRVGLGELAVGEGVSRAAMCKHVDRLEAAAMVKRLPGSSDDRRRVAIELTPEGERVLRRVRSQRTAWLATRLDRVDETELEAIDSAIEPLQALLR
jgi:DNA-binding MarR family transcriptional regulator